MQKLSKSLDGIVGLIKNKSNVVYLEYPIYLNIGDLLIYHGAEELLKQHGIKPKHRISLEEFSLEKLVNVIDPETTILFQGGGNFGDLYQGKQRMRESVVSHFINNRIIILPQTIHFQSSKNLVKSAGIFKKHKDVHICCRDEISAQEFSLFSDSIHLFPDTAHRLVNCLKMNAATKKKLFFIRQDKEKSTSEKTSKFFSDDKESVDWKNVLYKRDYVFQVIFSNLSRLNRRVDSKLLNKIIWNCWFKYSKHLINRCSRYFSNYEEICTSRLHGHILTCLVNRKSQVMDNAYGKNSRYCKAWTARLNNVEFESFVE
ncbi:polysaccharide pyruvyl transferase family protein [Vibrio atlanticus]|nr:polysaccharide pyruvyl transferase family protein [Vibrio atlanticus]